MPDAKSDGPTGTQVLELTLRARGIRRLPIMGVHTNACIPKRSFAIKQMVRWRTRSLCFAT